MKQWSLPAINGLFGVTNNSSLPSYLDALLRSDFLSGSREGQNLSIYYEVRRSAILVTRIGRQ